MVRGSVRIQLFLVLHPRLRFKLSRGYQLLVLGGCRIQPSTKEREISPSLRLNIQAPLGCNHGTRDYYFTFSFEVYILQHTGR